MLLLLGCKGSGEDGGTGQCLLAEVYGVPQVVGALHPLVRRERHRIPAATSFAASQGCERSTGQDRRAEPVLPHFASNGLYLRLSRRPMKRSPAVDRCPDWGFWLFFKGFIYK